jgi:DNA polymerase III delta prime subunit
MEDFIIKKANRSDSKVLISLAGLSGCGKTYSAILLARGLVGETGKIGFIDTEQCRASLYSDLAGGFDTINMEAPFSPDRYIKAVDAFKKAGYGAVIIDSMSHEWEGVGGVLEMAESQKYANGKEMQGMAKWAKPKAEHKKMMDYLLHCGMHIIFCFRAKERMREEIVDGKKIYINDGLITTTEKNFIYEMTVSLLLDVETKFPKVIKCPEQLEHLFPSNKFINQSAGLEIEKWLNNKQRTKEEIIAEGKESSDKKAWFMSLPSNEGYIARKYKDEIMSMETEPVIVKKANVSIDEDDGII